MEEEIVLRPRQVATVEVLRQGFRDKHIRQVLVASTGFGKSVVMKFMIKSGISRGQRIMFLCERRVLVEQFSKHLDEARIPHGVLMAKHWRYRPYEKVQVCSAQTLEKMKDLPEVDILFIDELHACMRASVVKLIEQRPNLRIVGATATPFNPLIGKYFTNHTNTSTMEQLVAEGNLAPARVFIATEIDTEGVKIVAGEFKKDELEERGKKIVGDVVSDYVRISHEVFGGFVKTICFSCGIEHGAELAKKFSEVGVNAVQISSDDDEEYKSEVLADFARPDTKINMVISVAILSRGFDQPDVKYVIIARPLKKSFSEHVQMVGRGARPYPGKDFFVVQDSAGNWMRFMEQWTDLYENGVTSLTGGQDEKAKAEPSQEQKEAAKCPKCGCVWPFGSDVCANCGNVRVRRSEVVNVPGEMVELETAQQKATRQAWWSGYLGLAQERGKDQGWAFGKYLGKFPGTNTKGLQNDPMEPTPEMRSYERSQRIRYAKGLAKKNAGRK